MCPPDPAGTPGVHPSRCCRRSPGGIDAMGTPALRSHLPVEHLVMVARHVPLCRARRAALMASSRATSPAAPWSVPPSTAEANQCRRPPICAPRLGPLGGGNHLVKPRPSDTRVGSVGTITTSFHAAGPRPSARRRPHRRASRPTVAATADITRPYLAIPWRIDHLGNSRRCHTSASGAESGPLLFGPGRQPRDSTQ